MILNPESHFGLKETIALLLSLEKPKRRSVIVREIGSELASRLERANSLGNSLADKSRKACEGWCNGDFHLAGTEYAKANLALVISQHPVYVDHNDAILLPPPSVMELIRLRLHLLR
ncbi:hypothetical protein OpiT1DRAFT_05669 [Opitutaceae bacterium TAV1]|nr:hypothetical protein OpiT1DRAFT_05669 [Opitutaceae bacterium TAV1]